MSATARGERSTDLSRAAFFAKPTRRRLLARIMWQPNAGRSQQNGGHHFENHVLAPDLQPAACLSEAVRHGSDKNTRRR
jgi:hypothetical protein